MCVVIVKTLILIAVLTICLAPIHQKAYPNARNILSLAPKNKTIRDATLNFGP